MWLWHQCYDYRYRRREYVSSPRTRNWNMLCWNQVVIKCQIKYIILPHQVGNNLLPRIRLVFHLLQHNTFPKCYPNGLIVCRDISLSGIIIKTLSLYNYNYSGLLLASVGLFNDLQPNSSYSLQFTKKYGAIKPQNYSP